MMNLNQFDIDFNELEITVPDIASEIGYKENEIPEYIYSDIKDIINEFKEKSKLKGGFIIYDSIEINSSDISINNIKLKTSEIISKALFNSEEAAVFVCTTGHLSDQIIKTYKQSGDILKSYLADIVASALAENCAEQISKKLKEYALKKSMKTTGRFSPGYCSWDVSEQKKLFSMLPKDFCDIKLTKYALMTPFKSVSGIIGIGKNVINGNYYCNFCTKTDCLFFKK